MRAPAGEQDKWEMIESYARDGVVCVRGVLDPEQIQQAIRGIHQVLAKPSPPALMATPEVRLYHDHVLVKEGGTKQRTPWHQDQPYYNVDGRGVSAWIPVDPVPEAGCLEVLAGSHRGQWLLPRTFLAGEAKWFPERALAELPDVEADRSAFDIRQYGMALGDAIFFDFLAAHGAPGFPFAGRRRVLSLRYLSAGVRHAPLRWRTSPPFDGLDRELGAGQPMDHPLFPVVWPPSS